MADYMKEFCQNLPDPLTIAWKRLLSSLLLALPSSSPYHAAIYSAQNTSLHNILSTLSQLLAEPPLTLLIAEFFAPVLIDLTARWLVDEADDYTIFKRFRALALLIQVHEELYPVLASFIQKPCFVEGPVAFIIKQFPESESLSILLEYALLAYFRVLDAGREIIADVSWDLSYLSTIIWSPNQPNGVRWLAIRCYYWQVNMPESAREKVEREVFGDIGGVDCPIHYNEDISGNIEMLDGWMLPIYEAKRVRDSRQRIAESQQNYFSNFDDDIVMEQTNELSPLTVNVYGVLMLRKQVSLQPIQSSFVATPSSICCIRQLSIHMSLQLPVVISSPPSSGKSTVLNHLASLMFPDSASSQLVTINMADTSLDPRSLLGSYVSSTVNPGVFEWKDGVLVQAMRKGKWLVLKDIDRGSSEVLGLLSPLVESLSGAKEIGARAFVGVPGRGTVRAASSFAIIGTVSSEKSHDIGYKNPSFLNDHKWSHVNMSSPTEEDLAMIVETQYPLLSGPICHCLIRIWKAVATVPIGPSVRRTTIRDLLAICARVTSLLSVSPLSNSYPLPSSSNPTPQKLSSIIQDPILIEEIYLESRDIFFGSASMTSASQHWLESVTSIIGDILGLSSERQLWLPERTTDFLVERNIEGLTVAVVAGRTRILASKPKLSSQVNPSKAFALHKPAIQYLSRICTCIAMREPVLLTGETGTGKTSLITHMATLLNKTLISLNLSVQSEASDLIGGFKPIETRIPASELQGRFTELFERTFSRKKNKTFEEGLHRAILNASWKRVIKLWMEAGRLAQEKFSSAREQSQNIGNDRDRLESTVPRKRQKMDDLNSHNLETDWSQFLQDVHTFEIQHIQSKGKFVFDFVEGPLVRALKSGAWVLLDEINLASSETLESILNILQSPLSSITLIERGSMEPVVRHPDFRLFACMNPATDVGKKDLSPRLRSRFTEIFVSPPDTDKATLLSIVSHYIGRYAHNDKPALDDIAEFYITARDLAEKGMITDGSNRRPHYSMRTLSRTLTFAGDIAGQYGLRRGLWEGCLMAFAMPLDNASRDILLDVARKHILSGAKNPGSLLSRVVLPHLQSTEILIGPFWLEMGSYEVNLLHDYVLTPSVEKKIVDLARIVSGKGLPVLIEGPTSSGKTSAVEYLARRTGHKFVRINNHEHTDVQEYFGSYVSDPGTGKLVYRDGLLVQALRKGDWIVLDELNLAPSYVLEALNRLLDDNRELLIPETQEVIKPHPHFRLFATQNPPGIYAGRKILSRAFRNRFIEVNFEDIPRDELETILCQRCRIAPSYGKRIVKVFHELQVRRQTGRVFEGKHGFATLRDLFRWAQRGASSYQELAETGYMLLAERARRSDDKIVVKEIIEEVMKVHIDLETLYDFDKYKSKSLEFIGCTIPDSTNIVWTKSMRRLFILLARALRHQEPVLLVGETGSGKTSVCQIYADCARRRLVCVNGQQNTEAADLIGTQRPVRRKMPTEIEILNNAKTILGQAGIEDLGDDPIILKEAIAKLRQTLSSPKDEISRLGELEHRLTSLIGLFKWYDGPLVSCMRSGDIFLLDEISLVDDSVLERMNSVLEPSRTIVLAERGGEDIDESHVVATDEFKLIATMNPGGDYGKKELSPALRNRFTEIWVPAINERSDLELIINSSWQHKALISHTGPLLNFIEWLKQEIDNQSIASLRDILAWVQFSNVSVQHTHSTLSDIFMHAACMTFLDGLAAFPQLSSWSQENLRSLRQRAAAQLQLLLRSDEIKVDRNIAAEFPLSDRYYIGAFGISRGSQGTSSTPSVSFNLEVPTTRDNAMRVLRACQLKKSILLEGSPGVGKTSLISALAVATGHQLHRLNFSEQTDLVDLFGTDLPAENGQHGQFVWREALFLSALQEGHWVLLDEMNLAPQSVLEGLNSVLDHRGAIYIPELDRTFNCHPDFRIFAAQNPLREGGGRKGLPKSFLNRFTKVYIENMTETDMQLICSHMFPALQKNILELMVKFNCRLHEELNVKQSFGQNGAPWEINLRDVIRWASLTTDKENGDPEEFFYVVYAARFRCISDREYLYKIFRHVFNRPETDVDIRPWPSVSANHVQFGKAVIDRNASALPRTLSFFLPNQLKSLEAALTCVSHNWLVIVTGPAGSGKTGLIKTLAEYSGQELNELSLNSASESADLIGSYEQIDSQYRIRVILQNILRLTEDHLSYCPDARSSFPFKEIRLLNDFLKDDSFDNFVDIKSICDRILDSLEESNFSLISKIRSSLVSVVEEANLFRFEWVDGPLVEAVQSGYWLLLNDVNLCNPSVLDRLNSLCEDDGALALNERGGNSITVRPHPNFRLFMTANTLHGELSRAMRNRGIEIALDNITEIQSLKRIASAKRAPIAMPIENQPTLDMRLHFDLRRRGLVEAHYLHLSVCTGFRSVIPSRDSISGLLDKFTLLLSGLNGSNIVGAITFLAQLWLPDYPNHLLRFLQLFLASDDALTREKVFFVISKLRQFAELSIVSNLRSLYSSIGGSILRTQPLNVFLNSSLGDDLSVRDQQLLRHLMEVHTRLAVHSFSLTIPSPSQIPFGTLSSSMKSFSLDKNGDEVRQELGSLIKRMLGTIETLLSAPANVNHDDLLKVLKLSSKFLMSMPLFTEILENFTLNTSAVYAIVLWVSELMRDAPDTIFTFKQSVLALSQSAKNMSGPLFFEIWSSFASLRQPHPKEADILRMQSTKLENMSMADSKILHELWCSILRDGDYGDTQVASSPVPDMQVVNNEIMTTNYQCLQSYTPAVLNSKSFLIMELFNLAICGPLGIDNKVEVFSQVTQLAELAFLSPISFLSRNLCYMRILNNSRGNSAYTSDVVQTHIGWLQALWTGNDLHISNSGSLNVLSPWLLRSTLQICRGEGCSIAQSNMYEVELVNNIALVLLEEKRKSDRLWEILYFLTQSIVLLCTCIPEFSADIDSSRLMQDFIVHSTFEPQAFLRSLKSFLQDHCYGTIASTLQMEIVPAFDAAIQHAISDVTAIADLGQCFLALSRTIMTLYVPTYPLDPLTVQLYQDKIWAQLADQINAYNTFLIKLEKETTGGEHNAVIEKLRHDLRECESRMQKRSMYSFRDSSPATLSLLHAFWHEQRTFIDNILSREKLSRVVTALKEDVEGAIRRTEVIQESITGFIQRINATFGIFQDLWKPLELAYLQCRFGLSLLSQNYKRAQISTAVLFPDIYAALHLVGIELPTTYHSAHCAPQELLMHLASAIYVAMSSDNIPALMSRIGALYELLYTIQRQQEDITAEREEKSQSLYRTRDHGELSEDLSQEQELSYNSSSNLNESLQSNTANSESSDFNVNPFADTIMSLHLNIFGDRACCDISVTWLDLYVQFLDQTVEHHFDNLSANWDFSSTPYRLRLLSQKKSAFRTAESRKENCHFYNESNILEMRKAAAIVSVFKTQLEELFILWPEKTTLLQLIERCNGFLALPLHTAIIKALPAVEQIAIQMEDWELQNSADSALQEHQQAVLSLILDWRKIEVDSWYSLLTEQAKILSSNVAKWWFRLYEVAVDGIVKVHKCGAMAVNEYLDEMIALVDDYIRTSPIGQYSPRLTLLRSFSTYMTYLASVEKESSITLLRAARIVASISNEYSQFSIQVDKHLIDETAVIEKRMVDYIGSITWKDLNINAMRHSARRYHADISKFVRTYKDTLRQPAESFFTVNVLTATDLENTLEDQCVTERKDLEILRSRYTSYSHPVADNVWSSGLGSFLNLPAVYSKFGGLLETDLSILTASSNAYQMEDFTLSIFQAVENLVNAKPTESLRGDTKAFQKNLIARKRKTWSDVLKELRRMGLTAHVKQDILIKHRNRRWLLEQPLFGKHSMMINDVEKSEKYFKPVIATISRLRSMHSRHHDDVPKREFQRCIMVLECGLSLAMDTRQRFSLILEYHTRFHGITSRIRSLLHNEGFRASGDLVSKYISSVLTLLSRSERSLQHLSSSATDILNLTTDKLVEAGLTKFLSKVEGLNMSLKQMLTEIKELTRKVQVTKLPLLLKDEFELLLNAQAQIDSILTFLKDETYADIGVNHMTDTVFEKLMSSLVDLPVLTTANPINVKIADIKSSSRTLLQLFLGVWQALVAQSKSDMVVDAKQDNYTRLYSSSLDEVTRSLKMKEIIDHLDELVVCAEYCDQDEMQNVFREILPFLDTYLLFVSWHCKNCSRWNMSFWKLMRVLSAILFRVSTDGFCQPDGVSDNNDFAEASSDGLGFGGGKGEGDITDQVQDLDQVEGLKNDSDDSPWSGQGKNDDAIEMEHGFDSISDTLENEMDDEDPNNETEEDKDKENSNSHSDAVDEDFWGLSGNAIQSSDDMNQEKSDEKNLNHSPEAETTHNLNDLNILENQEGQLAQSVGENVMPEVQAPKFDLETENDNGLIDAMSIDSPNLSNNQLDADTNESAHDPEVPPDSNTEIFDDTVFSPSNDVDDDDDDDVQSEKEHDATNDHATENQSENGTESEESDATQTEGNAERMDELQNSSEQTQDTEDAKTPRDTFHNTSIRQSSQNPPLQNNSEAGSIPKNARKSASNKASWLSPPKDVESSIPLQHDEIEKDDHSFNQASEQHHNGASELDIPSSGNGEESFGVGAMEIIDPDLSDETSMQALGPAGRERTTKLNELGNSDPMQDSPFQNKKLEEAGTRPLDNIDEKNNLSILPNVHLKSYTGLEEHHIKSWNFRQGSDSQQNSTTSDDNERVNSAEAAEMFSTSLPADAVESEFNQWHNSDHQSNRPEVIWRLYRGLTENLANELCEQLRLILEPTMATRLKGDFSTGKRLNMKKVIPYIASGYTKDKIWLRRMRPSEREYQVLIALDDSKSMADSHSVHLAFETLALVTTALSRLEVGDIAVAKFGESVEIIHDFSKGAFNDEDGNDVVDAFHFRQDATNVLSLVETSTTFLSNARESRTSRSNLSAELWQLEIIISDGICQDHSSLRAALARAAEQRILVVFIVVDALQRPEDSLHTDTNRSILMQPSILEMNQVQYEHVDGKMELQIKRYLDSFPFEYFAVLRHVDTLPEVLSGILKQFFERMSEM